MKPIHKILAPVDFSACSEAAAQYAVELAEKLGAEVTLFNAYFLPVAVPFPDGSAYIPSAETLADLAGVSVRELRALRDRVQRPGVKIVMASAEGPAKQLIPHLATGFDLLIIGTHGRTGLSHLLLGSVAESVVRHAPCPVLTVHPPQSAATHAA